MNATIQLTQINCEDGATIIGNYETLIVLLHRAFREAPGFHRICTEALLTFDTEDGCKAIDVSNPATEPEKEAL